jgi:hypothetical protein
MNERIQELAVEARLRPALLLYYYRTIHGLTDTEQEELEQIEKFAKLIVRECMEVAVNKDSGYMHTADVAGYMAAGRSTAAQMIKKHFGVEE